MREGVRPPGRRLRLVIVVLLLILLAIQLGKTLVVELLSRGPVPIGSPTSAPSGPEWIHLLDATRRDGWKNVTDDLDIFEFQDDVLHVYGKTWYPLRYVAYTNEPFGNFDLHLEYKVAARANSGVFLRAQANDPVYRGFEVQVLDDFGNPPGKHGAGAIYDVVTPMFNMSRPAGEWNSFDISLNGQQVTVVMNGWLIVQTDLSKMETPLGKFEVAYKDLPLDGLLALQDHGGEVWYRNILLRKR